MPPGATDGDETPAFPILGIMPSERGMATRKRGVK